MNRKCPCAAFPHGGRRKTGGKVDTFGYDQRFRHQHPARVAYGAHDTPDPDRAVSNSLRYELSACNANERSVLYIPRKVSDRRFCLLLAPCIANAAHQPHDYDRAFGKHSHRGTLTKKRERSAVDATTDSLRHRLPSSTCLLFGIAE